ncbi:MAG: hypothetical protein WC784_04440 [Candidatus Shapirobacteria bacterium]|jgi:hypothetical protein
MAQRTNLNTKENPIKYILGSILLLIISGIGIFYLANNNKNQISESLGPTVTPTEKILVTPTIEITPTIEATKSVKLTVTPTIKVASVSATPTLVALLTFSNKSDAFSVQYKSQRTVYSDKEESGNRYTFYSPKGNIAVHVGKSWSWVYSDRNYSNGLLVDGVNTFVYEISNQKIVDFEKGDLKYTIQCVHNGIAALKTECDAFIKSFKFI